MSFFVSPLNTSGEGRPVRETFARLGYYVNKWIRDVKGVRWQAWNGTSCRRAVEFVQEKVKFHRDYWGTAAGMCCSPADFQGRPTNPFLCSYHRQISSSLCVSVCVCGETGGWMYVCAECSGAHFRLRHSRWPVNSSRGPRQQTTGDGGQTRGRTAEQRPTTAATRWINVLLWIVIAPDWQISVQLILFNPFWTAASVIANITPCQRQSPSFVYTTRWSYAHHEQGLVCHQLGICNHVPVMRSQGCAFCISITTES